MQLYELRQPVKAARYERSVNERAVFELINVRGGASFTNARGHLEVYNISGSASSVEVHEGQWVVALGADFLVLDDEAFNAQFVEGP